MLSLGYTCRIAWLPSAVVLAPRQDMKRADHLAQGTMKRSWTTFIRTLRRRIIKVSHELGRRLAHLTTTDDGRLGKVIDSTVKDIITCAWYFLRNMTLNRESYWPI